ncbi:MAG: peptidoglycan DD-metalloendopeptidase family protein [Anaerolineae bacterium]|nr:peptidoglycan DD-metalloendopeptidase family protein [Anaerolineae bacterium]NIN96650.1 peptidoglycan DD-metalloendopeptidase family protein [Anaerolineae bacterium]NIQ79683.1 peptidoglycan DD-metalloendopeptidase family protein [Anaerolineae bacterium]
MLRQVRGFSLALFLFVGSLLIGRLGTGNTLPMTPVERPSPRSTSTPTAPTAAATHTTAPTETPTPLPPTPTVQLEGTVILDEHNFTAHRLEPGSLIHPLRMAVRGSDAYVLDTGQLKVISLSDPPSSRVIVPPDNKVGGVLVQEVADIALSGDELSVLLLDRAGNLFRYDLEDGGWQVERLAHMSEASSRQHLTSLCAEDDQVFLLDSNVGQMWRHWGGGAEVIPVEIDLRGSIDFAAGQDIYVLAQEEYGGSVRLHRMSGRPLRSQTSFVPPPDLVDPSLLFLDQGGEGHLYVIDQGYQRLSVLDGESGGLVRQYLFRNGATEIRSVYRDRNKMYLAARDAIYVYPSEPGPVPTPEPRPTPAAALSSLAPHDPLVLDLLPPLSLPISGTMLSDLDFRLPGAPRSYRYGVHQGIDFYSAAGEAVTPETPVLSVAAGEVIRVDHGYVAPSTQEMEEMLAHTREVYHTPEDILDALRGRQVWIDHGDGLVSRYCHLSAVADDLELGHWVQRGQFLGYVGNSGTPASYYGEGREMHLHLDIRVGDGYLGQYLRPVEVRQWLSQVFGADV